MESIASQSNVQDFAPTDAIVLSPAASVEDVSKITIHSKCPQCHHWYNKVSIPCPRPQDKGQSYDLKCPNCHTTLIRIGTESSQESFMSQLTIPLQNITASNDNYSSIGAVISGDMGSSPPIRLMRERANSSPHVPINPDQPTSAGSPLPPQEVSQGEKAPIADQQPPTVSSQLVPESRLESPDHRIETIGSRSDLRRFTLDDSSSVAMNTGIFEYGNGRPATRDRTRRKRSFLLSLLPSNLQRILRSKRFRRHRLRTNVTEDPVTHVPRPSEPAHSTKDNSMRQTQPESNNSTLRIPDDAANNPEENRDIQIDRQSTGLRLSEDADAETLRPQTQDKEQTRLETRRQRSREAEQRELRQRCHHWPHCVFDVPDGGRFGRSRARSFPSRDAVDHFPVDHFHLDLRGRLRVDEVFRELQHEGRRLRDPHSEQDSSTRDGHMNSTPSHVSTWDSFATTLSDNLPSETASSHQTLASYPPTHVSPPRLHTNFDATFRDDLDHTPRQPNYTHSGTSMDHSPHSVEEDLRGVGDGLIHEPDRNDYNTE